jgi:hypothetical protein
MNRVLVLLMLAVGLALAKALVAALLITLLLVVVCALVTRPGETLASLGCAVIFGLACAQPIAFIITLGVLGVVAVVVAGAKRKSRGQTRLADIEGDPLEQLFLADGSRRPPD